jgi:hypothetical protein
MSFECGMLCIGDLFTGISVVAHALSETCFICQSSLGGSCYSDWNCFKFWILWASAETWISSVWSTDSHLFIHWSLFGSTDNSAHHLGRDRWKVRKSPSLALGSLGLGGGWYGGGGGNGGSPGHCLFTIGPHKFEFPWKLYTWINPLSIQNLNPIVETPFNPIHNVPTPHLSLPLPW